MRHRFYPTGSSIELDFEELPLIVRKGFGALRVNVNARIGFGDEPENDWHVDLSASIRAESYNTKTREMSFIDIERGDEFFNAIVQAIETTQHDYVMREINASDDAPYVSQDTYSPAAIIALTDSGSSFGAILAAAE